MGTRLEQVSELYVIILAVFQHDTFQLLHENRQGEDRWQIIPNTDAVKEEDLA